jgi:hypothetical protein
MHRIVAYFLIENQIRLQVKILQMPVSVYNADDNIQYDKVIL